MSRFAYGFLGLGALCWRGAWAALGAGFGAVFAWALGALCGRGAAAGFGAAVAFGVHRGFAL